MGTEHKICSACGFRWSYSWRSRCYRCSEVLAGSGQGSGGARTKRKQANKLGRWAAGPPPVPSTPAADSSAAAPEAKADLGSLVAMAEASKKNLGEEHPLTVEAFKLLRAAREEKFQQKPGWARMQAKEQLLQRRKKAHGAVEASVERLVAEREAIEKNIAEKKEELARLSVEIAGLEAECEKASADAAAEPPLPEQADIFGTILGRIPLEARGAPGYAELQDILAKAKEVEEKLVGTLPAAPADRSEAAGSAGGGGAAMPASSAMSVDGGGGEAEPAGGKRPPVEEEALPMSEQLELVQLLYPERVEDLKDPKLAEELLAKAVEGWRFFGQKRRKKG